MLGGRERVTLFLGNFGSGKTEVAVNYALSLGGRGDVVLADLDLVNPYFRSRESRAVLEGAGVRVVAPEGGYHHADLPILLPQVRAVLMSSTAQVVLDVGGDDVGSRVLGSLHDALPEGSYRAFAVLNGNRPFTSSVGGIGKILGEIEGAGRVRVTGFVSNTHLMEETTLDTVLAGHALAREAEQALGLPLEFVCAPPNMAEEVAGLTGCDVLPLTRYLSFPWQVPATPKVGSELWHL